MTTGQPARESVTSALREAQAPYADSTHAANHPRENAPPPSSKPAGKASSRRGAAQCEGRSGPSVLHERSALLGRTPPRPDASTGLPDALSAAFLRPPMLATPAAVDQPPPGGACLCLTRGNKSTAGMHPSDLRPDGEILRARLYRRELRARLAHAESMLGRLSTAEALRSCEVGMWQWDFSTEEPAPIVDRGGRPIARSTYCDHRLCPRCCARRAVENRDRLLPGIEQALRLDPRIKLKRGGSLDADEEGPAYVDKPRQPVFMTLDQRARPGESLALTAERILEAFGRLRRREAWLDRVRGCLVCLEVTRNPIGGWWHVHLHVVADVDWYEHADLLAEWRDCLGEWPEDASKTPGGCHISRVSDAAEALREAIKYTCKGLSSAFDDGETVALDTMDDVELQELVGWIRGRRLCRTYGSFYGIKLNEDGELDVEENDVPKDWSEGENSLDPIVGINAVNGNYVHKSTATQVFDDEMTEGAWQWVSALYREAKQRQRSSTSALALGALTGPPDTGPPDGVLQ